MKGYKVSDLSGIQKKQGYKHIALFDQLGNPIVKFNTNAISPAQRLREIETRLISEALPDGNYIFKGKNSPSKNVYTDDYLIIKGKPEILSEPAAPAAPAAPVNFSPEVLTYESALRLQVENERLKLENANLLMRIEELEEELTSVESENSLLSEEKAPNLLESGKAFLSEIVTIAAPLLDKHFELKEKQLSLQALAMQQRMNTRRPSPEQAPQAKREQHVNRILSVESWINGFKEDPETYEALAAIYNNAENEPDFMITLKNEMPDLFNDLNQKLNT